MRRSAPFSVALALVLFALPAALAAMVTFERLQINRINLYHSMVADLGPYGDRVIAPVKIARYAYWLSTSGSRGRPQWNAMSMTRAQWLAPRRFTIIAAFLTGAVAAWAVLLVLSRHRRILPLAASGTERFWTVCGAMRSTWAWSLAAGALAAAIAWHIGFDRQGWSAPLDDGRVPGKIQLAGLVAGWWLVSIVIAAARLPSSLARVVGPAMADRVLCRRCGYSLIGLDGRNCPECGASGTAGRWQQGRSWAEFRRIARRSIGVLSVLAAILLVVAAASPKARDWLMLRPQALPAQAFPAGFTCGWIASGEAPQRWQSVYGVLTVSATFHKPSDRQEGVWTFAWTLEPVANFKTEATAGTFQVPVTYGTRERPDLHRHELPCGPIAFSSMQNDPRLHVLVPCIIFSDTGVWSRPIPPP